MAGQLGLQRILLADNGIVSLNLPISGQLIGALASRSTHPKFINHFNELIADVLPTPAQVSNPFWARTRAEVLSILKTTNTQTLLQETNSCSRSRGRPSAQPQCGFCSQCVDRRFGALAAGLEEHDLTEKYELDIFRQALPEGEAQTIAVSYVTFAREISRLTDDLLFEQYSQLYDALLPHDPAPPQTAAALVALLRRHARSTLAVVADLVAWYGEELAAGTLPEDCLLRLVVGCPRGPIPEQDHEQNVFQLEGQIWTVMFRGKTARFKNAVGFGYLARLLREPGREIHVRDLVAAQTGVAGPAASSTFGKATPQELRSEGLRSRRRESSTDVLDRQARGEYQRRIADLRAELQEAERFNDLERSASLKPLVTN